MSCFGRSDFTLERSIDDHQSKGITVTLSLVLVVLLLLLLHAFFSSFVWNVMFSFSHTVSLGFFPADFVMIATDR